MFVGFADIAGWGMKTPGSAVEVGNRGHLHDGIVIKISGRRFPRSFADEYAVCK